MIEDACRGFNFKPDDSKAAIEESRSAGVTLIQSRDLLAMPGRS